MPLAVELPMVDHKGSPCGITRSCLEMWQSNHPKCCNKQLKRGGLNHVKPKNGHWIAGFEETKAAPGPGSTWTPENGGFELWTTKRLQLKYDERIRLWPGRRISIGDFNGKHPLNKLSEIGVRCLSSLKKNWDVSSWFIMYLQPKLKCPILKSF